MDKKNKNNPFRREGGGFGSGRGRVEKHKKESEWGKVKFNPVAKTAPTEQATPWSHFKNEIIQKQQDDKRDLQGNLKNSNAQEILKKREETYRRHLIESKRNEPTQWEDFSEETSATSKSKKNKAPLNGKFQAIPSIIKDFGSKKNFDSRKLTSEQNNFLKKVITRHTTTSKGVSFKQAVSDMKLHGVKRKPFKK